MRVRAFVGGWARERLLAIMTWAAVPPLALDADAIEADAPISVRLSVCQPNHAHRRQVGRSHVILQGTSGHLLVQNPGDLFA